MGGILCEFDLHPIILKSPYALKEMFTFGVVLLHCGCLSLIPFIEFMNLEFGTTHQVQMC